MSLITPKFLKYSQSPRRVRFSRTLCAMFCLFLLTAAPVLAEPIRINQVVQTLSSSQGVPDLRLNNLVSQDPVQKGGTPQAGPRSDNGPATQGGIKTDSIISGVTITGEGKSIGVETIDEGEVEGTICDCGDILVAGGAFPKWPFLFLAAVPLAFIHNCDDCGDHNETTPTPTPPATPTPTPPGVPEPASIFLFGTGLAAAAAGLRRRLGKKKLDQQLGAEGSDSE